jgi:hypothetical protein
MIKWARHQDGQVKPLDDLTRLRTEYADHSRRLAGDDRYSWFNLSNLFGIQQRQRATLKLLKSQEISTLDNSLILEMGSV